MTFLACVHLALFLALSLSPGKLPTKLMQHFVPTTKSDTDLRPAARKGSVFHFGTFSCSERVIEI